MGPFLENEPNTKVWSIVAIVIVKLCQRVAALKRYNSVSPLTQGVHQSGEHRHLLRVPAYANVKRIMDPSFRLSLDPHARPLQS